jgi:hypothetical protein
MLLYISFHAVGIILLIQVETVSRIIGAFWLLISVLLFNYGLYRVLKEVCFVREANVNYLPDER